MLRSTFALFSLFVLLFSAHDAHAQRKTRFMKQLEKAEKEKAAKAAKERPYKTATARADSLFRLEQYAPAIDQYQLALDERPGDAFSLAKITDLRIIIKLQENPELTRAEAKELVVEEMRAEGFDLLPASDVELPSSLETREGEAVVINDSGQAIPQVPQVPTVPEVPPTPVEEDEIIAKVEAGQPSQPLQPAQPTVPETAPKEVETTAPKVRVKAKTVAVSESRPVEESAPEKEENPVLVQADGTPYPEGITEETIQGENSVTIRRIKREGVRTDVYRKVTHDWGGVFYFKNNISVTERIWKEETEPTK